jgi:hypothetical protein
MAVLDEYAEMAPSLFPSVVRPVLADRGGFAVIIGTVKGRNHLWETYESARASPDWYTVLLKASQTGQLSQEELASAKQTMSEEQYASEFLWRAPSGVYIPAFGWMLTVLVLTCRSICGNARTITLGSGCMREPSSSTTWTTGLLGIVSSRPLSSGSKSRRQQMTASSSICRRTTQEVGAL